MSAAPTNIFLQKIVYMCPSGGFSYWAGEQKPKQAGQRKLM